MLSPAVNITSPVLTVPLPANRFPNKQAPKVSNRISRNSPFCSCASFLIVSITPCINYPDSSSDLTIFIISFISSFEIINVLVPDPKCFLWTAAFVADAAGVNPNRIETLLANGLSTCPIKSNPVLSNGAKILPKNPPDYRILYNWVFDNFNLADEPFAEALRSFETCALA